MTSAVAKRARRESAPNIPNRPAGQRAEPQQRPFAFRGGAQFGLFPGLFGVHFQHGGGMAMGGGFDMGPPLTPEEARQQTISRIILAVGMCILFALLSY